MNILERIGNTPLIELKRINPFFPRVRVFAKAEFLNPSGSYKDRMVKKIIEEAEKRKELKKGMTLVEATTGSTGISLSFLGKVLGYKVIIVMPEGMSNERKQMMKALGAKIVYTKGTGIDVSLAIKKAKELCQKNKNYWFLNQFSNPDNIKAHYQTAKEIWRQTKGKIDVLIASYGTGGFLTGVGRFLKKKNPKIKVVAIEPKECALLSGGKATPHPLEGIADGLLPENLDKRIIDEVIVVESGEALEMTRKLAFLEGLFTGSSSGTNVLGAIKIAEKMKKGNIITVLPDRGERYFSTILYKEYLKN